MRAALGASELSCAREPMKELNPRLELGNVSTVPDAATGLCEVCTLVHCGEEDIPPR